jgi:predicted O-methyltransferase YrrM
MRVLREYEARSAAERELGEQMSEAEFGRRVNEFLLPIGPETGQFLNMLIKAANCRRILEVGTSYGYSTLWLAEAARATGGKVVTLEMAAEKAEFARQRMSAAGLAGQVEFKIGDALDSIAALKEPLDFVLIDLWKDMYVPCLERIYPRLAAGALLAADNILAPESSRAGTAKYVVAVRQLRGMQSVTVPIGSGIELSRFTVAAKP